MNRIFSRRKRPAIRLEPVREVLASGDGLPPVETGKHMPGIVDWLRKPDKQVTRAELWEFLHRYEAGRQRLARHNTWWRRLWRYLTAPIVSNDRPQKGSV